ncbi:DgyrCDS7526 [Dimorphilus gyrociliatus]|uniref:Replication factor C subunit 1 n=1 Tax=Dimorphilus gyrociliatus TaxID=2664684 RepID=A0A7I8VRE2_9ANNE|nr:DgyrCDS7526 [Dimorphilus gyrociliatus]
MDIRKFFAPSSTSKDANKKEPSKKTESDVSEVKKPRGKRQNDRSQSKQKSQTVAVEEDIILKTDSDSSMVKNAPKKGRRRKYGKKAQLESEDDLPKVKKVRKGFINSDDETDAPTKKSKKKEKPAPKKIVSSEEFFGEDKIQIAGTKGVKEKPNKKKKEEKTTIEKRIEIDQELHDDEDFMDTLDKLNKMEKEKVKKPSPAVVKTETKTNAKTPSPKKVIKVVKSPTKAKTKTPKKDDSPLSISKTPTPAKRPLTAPKSKTPTGESAPNMVKTPSSAKRNLAYAKFKQREGPRAVGQIEIPEGSENCLEGLVFVVTGVLEGLERDDAKHLVERYGGKVTTSISKRTSYLVMGRDPGASKEEKARKLGTKIITEEELYHLIKTLPGKKSKYEIAAEKEIKAEQDRDRKRNLTEKESTVPAKKMRQMVEKPVVKVVERERAETSHQTGANYLDRGQLWVDKYKPTNMKQLIGQQGDKSCARKLLNWLSSWHANRAAGRKPIFGGGKWADQDGGGYRAALLSGPPGIGKTTMSVLVCKELGYSFVELNASDSRSKKSITEQVSELLHCSSLSQWASGKDNKVDKKEHVLLMDEVDGMSGNEDRGGMQQLIQLIKTTKVPIICMANDRNHPKLRTLANYCFDLRVQRPRVEQIKSAIMTIAYKEGVKIAPNVLQDIIVSTNQDIRQVLHNLCLFSAGGDKPDEREAVKSKKDIQIGAFDACRKVFDPSCASNSIQEKTSLFFYDYSIAPLFVHENYIKVRPKDNHLMRLAKAADSIAIGDVVDKKIRGSSGSWSLLPTQAIFASLLPGEYMRGYMSGMINFPQWLGRNSTNNKNKRIVSQLTGHMRLNTSGDRQAINQDYLPVLRKRLTQPLIEKQNEGVKDVLTILEDYHLTREDMDSLLEITQWDGIDPMKSIESKTKAAFTRAFNKANFVLPYAIVTASKAKAKRAEVAADDDYETELGEDNIEESAEEDDITKDAMIKKAKKPSSKKQETKKTTEKKTTKKRGKS